VLCGPQLSCAEVDCADAKAGIPGPFRECPAKGRGKSAKSGQIKTVALATALGYDRWFHSNKIIVLKNVFKMLKYKKYEDQIQKIVESDLRDNFFKPVI